MEKLTLRSARMTLKVPAAEAKLVQATSSRSRNRAIALAMATGSSDGEVAMELRARASWSYMKAERQWRARRMRAKSSDFGDAASSSRRQSSRSLVFLASRLGRKQRSRWMKSWMSESIRPFIPSAIIHHPSILSLPSLLVLTPGKPRDVNLDVVSCELCLRRPFCSHSPSSAQCHGLSILTHQDHSL